MRFFLHMSKDIWFFFFCICQMNSKSNYVSAIHRTLSQCVTIGWNWFGKNLGQNFQPYSSFRMTAFDLFKHIQLRLTKKTHTQIHETNRKTTEIRFESNIDNELKCYAYLVILNSRFARKKNSYLNYIANVRSNHEFTFSINFCFWIYFSLFLNSMSSIYYNTQYVKCFRFWFLIISVLNWFWLNTICLLLALLWLNGWINRCFKNKLIFLRPQNEWGVLTKNTNNSDETICSTQFQ